MTSENLTNEQADRMLKAIMNPQPNNTTTAVILHDAEEKDFPASMPVLRMSRVGDQIHFSVCKETESATGYSYQHLHQMAFDITAFMNAVLAIVDDSSGNI